MNLVEVNRRPLSLPSGRLNEEASNTKTCIEEDVPCDEKDIDPNSLTNDRDTCICAITIVSYLDEGKNIPLVFLDIVDWGQ